MTDNARIAINLTETSIALLAQQTAEVIVTDNARPATVSTATQILHLTTSPPLTDTPNSTEILEATPTPTVFYVVVTSVPTHTRVPTPKPPTRVPPTAVPQPSVPSFGAGIKIIGTDIAPGTYRSNGRSSCYWERLGGFGGTVGEILANDIANGPVVVTISANDKGFNSRGCARWTQDLSPVTSNPTAPFGDGMFIVNTDIAPGTWRATGGGDCYWARLKGFSGEIQDIIANDVANPSPVVTINPGDAGFTNSRCGTWNKIN